MAGLTRELGLATEGTGHQDEKLDETATSGVIHCSFNSAVTIRHYDTPCPVKRYLLCVISCLAVVLVSRTFLLN